MPELIHVPPKTLTPSPTNPRGELRVTDEIVESIRTKGVLEPILAREIPKKKGGPSLEIVCGHRRHAAALTAGLDVVPVLVRTWTDDEVLDVQLAENLERNDLTPFEEAEAFQLRLERGQSIGHVGEKIGRSATYVAQRLKLLELAPKVRAALEKEEVTLAVAMLLARIPDKKLQEDGLDEVGGNAWDKPMSLDQARRTLESRFLLRLAGAPFDVGDPSLVKKAGPCTACPKRTGAQRELFPDTKSPDLCTDPSCYRSKLDAAWQIRAKEAKGEGIEVLEGGAAAKALTGNIWMRVDDEIWNGTRLVKVAVVVKKNPPPVALVRDEKTGAHVELVKRKDVEKLLGQGGATHHDSIKRAREKDKLRLEVVRRCLAAAVNASRALPLDRLFRIAVEGLVRASWHDTHKAIVSRRGLEVMKRKRAYAGDQGDYEETLLEAVRAANDEELRGYALELALLKDAPAKYRPSRSLWREVLDELCVNEKGLEAAVKAETRAKAKTKAAKKTPAKKKRAAKPEPKPEPAVGDGLGEKSEPGVCRGCGCTEEAACEGGCAWADATQTICSSCAGEQPRGKPGRSKRGATRPRKAE